MKNAAIPIALGLFFLSSLVISRIRGIRNNNLLNIKYRPSNNWLGQLGPDSKGFVVFTDPVYSLRAGFRILESYKKRGIDNIEEIIETFAPDTENDTEAYITALERMTGINRKIPLQRQQWPLLLQKMARIEVTKEPTADQILKAKSLAYA